MPAVLRIMCSEQVSYSLAVGPAETEELLAELPDKIRKDLLESLKHEIVVLRYDTPSRCAYYAARSLGFQSHSTQLRLVHQTCVDSIAACRRCYGDRRVAVVYSILARCSLSGSPRSSACASINRLNSSSS